MAPPARRATLEPAATRTPQQTAAANPTPADIRRADVRRADETREEEARAERDSAALTAWAAAFPLDVSHGLELAIARALAVPEATRLFLRSDAYRTDSVVRHTVAGAAVADLLTFPPHTRHGRETLAFVDRVHRAQGGTEDLFTYVCACLAVDTPAWFDAWADRPMTAEERAAWGRTVRRMAVAAGGPDPPSDPDGWRAVRDEYERTHFRYDPRNTELAAIAASVFAARWPRGTQWVGRRLFWSALPPDIYPYLGRRPPGRFVAALLTAHRLSRRWAMGRLPGLRRTGRRLGLLSEVNRLAAARPVVGPPAPAIALSDAPPDASSDAPAGQAPRPDGAGSGCPMASWRRSRAA